MATLEERVAALEAGYKSAFTGSAIDTILSRAQEGGTIDIKISAMRQDAVDDVEAATEAAKNAVKTQSTTEQKAIQDKGDEVLASIPADYQTGLSTLSTAITQETARSKDDVRLNMSMLGCSGNLFDPETVEKRRKLTSASAIPINAGAGNASLYVSDFIPVTPTCTYIVLRNMSTNSAGHWFYDAEQEPISYANSFGSPSIGGSDINRGDGPQIMTAPENAAYLRISGVDSNGTLYKQAVYQVQIPHEAIPDFDLIKAMLPGVNLFDPHTVHGHYAIRYDGTIVVSGNGAHSEFIRVVGGLTYKLAYGQGSSVYGLCWYDADREYLSGVILRGLKDIIVTAPENACWTRFTVGSGHWYDQAFTCVSSIPYDATPVLHTVSNGGKYRTTLAHYSTGGIGGLTYCAFSGGVIFDGKEVHATRCGVQHETVTDETKFGKIVFHVISPDGTIATTYPDIDFSAQEGDMRDPNLAVSNDGKTLFLSCFFRDTDGLSARIWALDRQYHVTSSCEIEKNSDYVAWGPLLQTPNGYLLKTAYRNKGPYVRLERSSAPFTGTLDGMTFETHIAIDGTHTNNPNECTIGYYKDWLVAFWRTTANSRISMTKNLEGTDGWSTPVDLEYPIHCPVICPHSSDPLLIFAGALNVDGRLPCVGLIDVSTPSIVKVTTFDDTCTGGGYPSFVRLDSTRFSTVYFDHGGSTASILYHRILDLRSFPGFMRRLDAASREADTGAASAQCALDSFRNATSKTTTWDDTAALRAAIADGRTVVLTPGKTYTISSAISLPSGCTITATGATLYAPNKNLIFTCSGVSGVRIDGGTFRGDGASDTQSLIQMSQVTNCLIQNVTVESALNKGISISGSYNTLRGVTCTGCSGTTGAGISLGNADSKYNSICDVRATDCRIGVTVNSAHHNTLCNIICVDCTNGVSLDGTVTGSGDGAHHNLLSGITTSGSGEAYGGIYMGNGAAENLVDGFTSTADYYAVRTATSNPNAITNGLISNGGGILISGGEHMLLSNLEIVDLTQGNAIYIYGNSFASILNCKIVGHDSSDATGCGGLRIMTDYATITGCTISGMKSGIYIYYGVQDKPPTEFLIENCWLFHNRYSFGGNAGASVKLGSTCKITPIPDTE